MLNLENYLKPLIDRTLQHLQYPPADYQFSRPKIAEHGDISINAAMLLARPLKQNPRSIAQQIVDAIDIDHQRISKVDIAGPGFINFHIALPELHSAIQKIITQSSHYGRFTRADSPTAQVEFVSANPTGPLTVGHGRQAVVGDTVANLLEWAGYEVSREYYFNNAGRQMRVLGDSVRYRYLQLLERMEGDFPEDHYQGSYITDIARKIRDEQGDDQADDPDNPIFKDSAEKLIFEDIKGTLEALGIHFDTYFNESDLYDDGSIEEVIRLFKEKNLAYEEDGALWLRATELGLDKDRVIVKSSGEPTYRLPDIAYHRTKFARGFSLLVDIFGADHIATYPDVLAGLKALDYDISSLKVLIHQFVTLFEGSEKVKMSTRKANFETLDDLIKDVGADATRWFFLMRSMQSHLNFDMKLARTRSNENPVFYNQYAHARICSIMKVAAEKGVVPDLQAPVAAIQEPAEQHLIKKLMDFPAMVKVAATDFEPHLLPQYLSDLSTAFHKFYTDCVVVDPENEQLSKARLVLCEATRVVLANGFKIVGVSAPESM